MPNARESPSYDHTYTLEDAYLRQDGRVYLDGVQALVRLLLMQRRSDVAAGLNTAGFVSGYPGSPLGALDLTLRRATDHLTSSQVRFSPGLNEDLAATAVWGTQQLEPESGPYDGVFGMWFGKGPGVDRSGDALKHANYAGTHPLGGVLAVCGDDHAARSSSIAHQSEQALISFGMPVLSPSSVQDYLDLGLAGYALSRYSRCWVGFICATDTVESAGSIDINPGRLSLISPDNEALSRLLGDPRTLPPADAERVLQQVRLPAAKAFARANRLDRCVFGSPHPRFGIITAGKAFQDVLQALGDLDIDDARARQLGLGIYKVALSWPLEPDGIREFAASAAELLVVEEKGAVVEPQVAGILYNDTSRPRLAGKYEVDGRVLVPATGELTGASVARSLATWMTRCTGESWTVPHSREVLQLAVTPAAGAPNRTPAFCSGCPHNISTKVPEGSKAMGGIGCHGLATYLPERRTSGVTQMGAEGANWIGKAPFSTERHVFQNLGDGTFFHSGLLAVRAAVAAGVDITYKILANDSVAMTGGQDIPGGLGVAGIAAQVAAEGVRRIAIVSDDIDKYRRPKGFPAGTSFHPREELDAVQRELRTLSGTTVLIYDQACAAEQRRLRKRGKLPQPQERVIINELVCEGCGDCNTASNCISVEPLETEYGRKRAINQSSCNHDLSCLDGYCPSLVTVHGAQPKSVSTPSVTGRQALFAGQPDTSSLPIPAVAQGEPYSVLVAGVGGAGIVTFGALVAMAAHLEGKSVSALNVLGMAQKNGPVTSHVRVSTDSGRQYPTRIGTHEADLLLAADPIVATSPDCLATLRGGRSRVVVNRHVAPTAQFAGNPDLDLSNEPLLSRLRSTAGPDAISAVNATERAQELFGDAILANTFLLGFASQSGLLPVGVDALTRAIELNAAAVDSNLQSFAWGRIAACQPERMPLSRDQHLAGGISQTEDVQSIIDDRAAFLSKYQNPAYAARYRALVARVRSAESSLSAAEPVTRAVARYYFKVLAYKDEYEVARLFTDGSFQAQLREQFEGRYRIELNLAPQILNRRDPITGRAPKRTYGSWILIPLRVLASARRLRGTRLDPFGKTEHRRRERELIVTYEGWINEICDGLCPENHATAVAIASLPEEIRGFDSIKDIAILTAAQRADALLCLLRVPHG
jgi:indolepyruvate ferredoxin oxidoreductase